MKSILFAMAAMVAICSSGYLRAQSDVIVHARPLHVRHFSGTIVDPTGMFVKFATVELHDVRDHRLLASTYADGNGFFTFDDKKYGKRVELRAFQKGFDVAQYTAVLRPFGDVHVRMVLTVGQ